DLDGAMKLHKEEERICRELGNINGLQACLGNQALILKARGDLHGAMKLFKEKERICRELGNVNGLAISLINQALILAQQNRHQEALSYAEEAYRLASGHGYTALAKQILPILEKIRKGE
ncbi:MAG: tetratricopeptide repeat protein, partial [Methanoregula sp.]|nr:tetratricopeptide repeat protein [Methanoregula sp.]